MPHATFIVVDGRCVYVNQTAVTMLKAPDKHAIVGKTMFEFIHPDDHQAMCQWISRVQEGYTVELMEEQFISFDGEVIDVEVTAIPMYYQGERAQHIIACDITELKKSREMLQNSEKLSVVGELAAGIAHEIRNPLTSLRGFVQLFQHKVGEQDQEYLRIMLAEIDRINTIVNELLLLAKPKKMDFENKNLLVLLEEVIALLLPQAHLFNIQIITRFESFSPFIYCAENKLKQVFINILKNAMEAMPNGGEVFIQVKFVDDKVLILFVDHGCGIPAESLPKIGQAFFTTKEKGTGLGLMISYSIIDSHGGLLRIESRDNEGTTVEILLPISEGPVISLPTRQFLGVGSPM